MRKSFFLFLALALVKIDFAFGQSCTSRYAPFYNGTCAARSTCTGALLNNLCPGQLACCIQETLKTSENFVSESELQSIIGYTNQRIKYLSKVLKAPTSYPTCHQKAAFLSQLLHESTKLSYDEEVGTEDYFKKYDLNAGLGNTQPGDGAKFKGRGYIQLTGRYNYQQAGNYLKIDLVNNPEIAALPSIAAKTAVWFWQFGKPINLNTLADGTFYNYSMMTSKINGGLNGIIDRTRILETAIDYLECGNLLKGKGDTCSIKSDKDANCKPLCVKGLEGKSYCGCNGQTKDGLCNGPRNVKCCLETCKNEMDLTFVIDSSGSISPNDFQRGLTFIANIVQNLEIGENKTRVALINFAYSIQTVAYLNSIYDKTKLLYTIRNIKHLAQSTYTGEALQQCKNIYSEKNGMRNTTEGVSRVIVVITDGGSNGPVRPGPVAESLRSSLFVNIISVGVGEGINFDELKEIASKDRVILIDNYQDAVASFDEITQVSCLEPARVTSITAKIAVPKDTFKYFYYPVSYEEGLNKVRVKANEIEGDVDLFVSFDNQNPNDLEVVDADDTRSLFKRNLSPVMIQLRSKDVVKVLSLPSFQNGTNTSNIYIGVKGKQDVNSFKLSIESFYSSSAKRLKELNNFLYLIIPFCLQLILTI